MIRRLLCLVLHGALVSFSDGFEWCAGCGRDYWRGRPWDGASTPEGKQ